MTEVSARGDVCLTCGKSGAHYVRDGGGPWHKYCLPPRNGRAMSLLSVGVMFKRIGDHDLPVPAHATDGASGLDLMATRDQRVEPGQWAKVATGWAIGLPAGYEAQVRPRSGIAIRHGVTVLNTPGTVDNDYTGEIQVILINHSDAGFNVRAGDRIAQLVVAPVMRVTSVEVDEIGETARGAGGFGSTGR